MKKIVLLAVIYLLIPSVGFCISDEALLIWKSEMGTTGSSNPLGGWTCTGSGKTASDVTIGESGISLRSIFPKGSPAYVPVDFENYGIVYVSNSSTDEEGRVEEWLISPEIDLSGAPDNMVIAFDVFSYGNSNSPLSGYMPHRQAATSRKTSLQKFMREKQRTAPPIRPTNVSIFQ